MAEQTKTGGKVTTNIDPVPVTQVDRVQIQSAQIKPSALAEFADRAVPALMKLGARDDGAQKKLDTSDIAMQVYKEASDKFEQLRENGSLDPRTYERDVRQWMTSRAHELYKERVAATGISDAAAFEKLQNNIHSFKEKDFYKGRVKAERGAGGQMTFIVDEDIVGSRFDLEGAQAEHMQMVKESFGPAVANSLAMGMMGLHTDGTPAENSDYMKARSTQLMFDVLSDVQALEGRLFKNKENEAVYKGLTNEKDVTKFFAENNKVAVLNSFSNVAGAQVQAMLVSDGGKFLELPADVAMGQLRSQLEHIRANTNAYALWETAAGDRDALDKAIDRVMVSAEKMFTGLNSVNLKKFTKDKQQYMLDIIASKEMLQLPPEVIAMIYNADNISQLLSSSIMYKGVAGTGIGIGNPVATAATALAGKTHAITIDSDINLINSSPTQIEKTPYLQSAVEKMKQHVVGLVDKTQSTGFSEYGVLEKIFDLKSAPGVHSWLGDPSIPLDVRQSYIRTVKEYENTVRKLGKFDNETLEALFGKKTATISGYFEGEKLPTADAPANE